MDWNSVKYLDCLNKETGLPTLPKNSVELCFTDPPLEKYYKIKKQKISNKDSKISNNKDINYKEWCNLWFSELKRICKTIMIHCHKISLNMWYEIEFPYDIILWHFKNTKKSSCNATSLTNFHPIVCYGKFGKKRLNKDIYTHNWFKHKKLIHPRPMNLTLVTEILKQFKPESFLDPFIGSGTTAEACHTLGIPWIGYEINKEYKKDISSRLKEKNFNKNAKQNKMDSFF